MHLVIDDLQRLYLLYYTSENEGLRFLSYFGFENSSRIDIYWANLYWMVTIVSTVGFGDFFPLNFIERLYVTGIMIFSALFFGYLVNAIGKFMIEN